MCSTSFCEEHTYIEIMPVRSQNKMVMLRQMSFERVGIKITLHTQIPEFFDIIYRNLFINHILKIQDVRIVT